MTPEEQLEEMRLGDLEREERKKTLEWAMELADAYHGAENPGTTAALSLAEWVTADTLALSADEIQRIADKGWTGWAAGTLLDGLLKDAMAGKGEIGDAFKERFGMTFEQYAWGDYSLPRVLDFVLDFNSDELGAGLPFYCARCGQEDAE